MRRPALCLRSLAPSRTRVGLVLSLGIALALVVVPLAYARLAEDTDARKPAPAKRPPTEPTLRLTCVPGIITNNAPPTVSPNPAHTSWTLSTTNGSWSPCRTGIHGYTYQWLRNGHPIPGANGSTLWIGAGEVGNVFHSQVAACGDEGCMSPVTSSNGSTIANWRPDTPGNLSPPSGTMSSSTTPTLSATFNDPDGQWGRVDFFVYDEYPSEWVDPIVWGYGGWTPPGTGSSWTVPPGYLFDGNTYWWVGAAWDGYDYSAESAVHSFTVHRPPNTPTNLSPPNGTISQNTQPTFSATYSDPDGQAGRVHFEVFRADSGALVAGGVGSYVGSGGTSSWTSPPLTSAEYVWEATAEDDAGWFGPTASASYTVNAPPPAPTALSPRDDSGVPRLPTTTPVLSVQPAADADQHLLSYQFRVSSAQACTAPVSPAAESGWNPSTTTWTVPPGVLQDGQPYYWCARTADFAEESAWSVAERFEIRVLKLGSRDYWPMWSHGPLAVNQATGNLVVSLPGPSYPTAVGAMGASVTYNSLATTGEGLGLRWTLDAGHDASPPAKLIDHNALPPGPNRYDAVERVSGDGSSDFYNRVGTSNTYLSAPGDGSQLSRNADGTWTLLDPDGALYTFDAAGADGIAKLRTVEWTDADRGMGLLRHCFNANGRIVSIRESDDCQAAGVRELAFNWSCTGALLCITGPDQVVWKYVGDASGRLAEIWIEGPGTTPAKQLFAVGYTAAGDAGLVNTIRNANDLAASAVGPHYNPSHKLLVTYQSGKVATVEDGPVTTTQVDGTMTSATPKWSFVYEAAAACPALTNPRAAHGAARLQLDGCTAMTPPREQGAAQPKVVRTFYDTLGHPIEIRDVLYSATLDNARLSAYDTHDRLLWSEDETGAPTDYTWTDVDGNPTSNPWVTTALASTTGPDPDGSGPLPRPVTTNRYDERRLADQPTLTASGHEITDASRAARVQGDGRSGDSSFGVWEATTNLAPNGGLESNQWWWWGGPNMETARSTTHAKFGSYSFSVRATSSTGDQHLISAGFNLAPSTTYTWSAWVYLPQAGRLDEGGYYLQENGGSWRRIGVLGSGTKLYAAGWHRLTGTGTTPADWLADTRVTMRPPVVSAGVYDTSLTMYFDGVQVEQKPFATPYVETNGASAGRPAAGPQGPATLLDKNQGWVAFRTRLGWGSTGDPAYPMFFSWGQMNAGVRSDINVVWEHVNNRFYLEQFTSGSQAVVGAPASTHSAGQIRTVVAAWTPTQLKISIDGAPFVTASRPSIPNLTAQNFHVGRWFNDGYRASSDLFWFSAGKGTLTDEDAQAIGDFGGETPGPPGFPTASLPSTVWTADTSAYEPAILPAGPRLQGLQGAYYNNVNLAGRPVKVQNDSNVDFTWGSGGPPAVCASACDNFSVRWTGYVAIPADGAYTFATVANDGTRLTIDGTLAINNWVDQVPTRVASQPIQLTRGLHKLTLEYFERLGTAEVELRWSCSISGEPTCTGSDVIIPTGSLRPGWMNQTSTVSPSGRLAFTHIPDPGKPRSDYTLVRQANGTKILTTYAYDEFGRTVEKVMPKGNQGRTVDANGDLGGTRDLTYATTWSYYGAGEAANQPAECGSTASVNQARLLKSITPRGVATTTFVYDAAGRQVSETDGDGTTYSCLDREGRTTKTRAPGDAAETVYTYDPGGQQRTANDANGTVETDYDEQGRRTRSKDSFDAEARFTYDAEGHMLRRVAATGRLASSPRYTTEYVHDADGHLTRVTDPAGRQYDFTYDKRGNLRTTQYPNGTFSWNDYNAAGWLKAVYNRHGNVGTNPPADAPADTQGNPLADFLYSYDVEGKKTSEKRVSGTEMTTSGGLITDAVRGAGTQGDGRAAESSFGVWEPTTNLLTNGSMETNRTGWGGWQSNLSVADLSQGGKAKFGSRSLKLESQGIQNGYAVGSDHYISGATAGRKFSGSAWVHAEGASVGKIAYLMVRETGGANGQYQETYKWFTLTAGWQRVTTTHTLLQNDRTVVTLLVYVPQGAAGEYVYIDGAQLEEKRIATPYVHTDGQTASRALGRVYGPAGSLSSSQGWVAVRMRLGWGNSNEPYGGSGFPCVLGWQNDWNNSIRVFYDEAANMFAAARVSGGSGPTAYVAQALSPDQMLTLVYAWTPTQLKLSINGQPFAIIANSSIPQLTSGILDFAQIGGGNHFNSDVVWAAAGRGTLTDAESAQLHGFGNNDPSGQLPGQPALVWTADNAGSETTRYQYDDIGRLERVWLPTGISRRYAFDLDSNRTAIVENGLTAASYVYDPTNPASDGVDQLTSVTENGQTRTFDHGPDGEMTRRGSDTITWDGWDRMSGGTFGGTTVTYAFDATGFRRQRASGGTTTRYLLGGLFETDGGGALTLADVDGAAGDLAQYAGAPATGSTVSYLYYNGHGDLTATADASANRTSSVTYDPFGAPRQAQPTNRTVERFTGKWDKKLDTATALIEMGARPYDPALGRFLAVDPVEGGGLNAYDYAYQDPINVYDLDGRCPVCLIALGVLVRAVAVIGIRWLAKKAANRAINKVMKNPERYLRGDSKKTIDYMRKLADKAGWKHGNIRSGRPGGFRMYDEGHKSIMFHPGGRRFDAAHGFGKPYWKISGRKGKIFVDR